MLQNLLAAQDLVTDYQHEQSTHSDSQFLKDSLEQCRDCPYKGQCSPKFKKTAATFITSQNASNRAKAQRFMQTDTFGCYAKIRNGVETVPANLRRNYHLEKLPRGKQKGKFFFGSKIAALNFRKLFNFRKGTGSYAPNPVLT